MKGKHEYLVPDYYPDFKCKMGECRTACCEGWPISLSMKDYFNLLGVECSAETRRRLDCGMHLAEHPMPEAYAHILPRYDGRCPMRMDDGRCALHAEVGEHVLAPVCRLYPRGVRAGEADECSCANSCEAVVELLLGRSAPIVFDKMTLNLVPPEEAPRQHHFEHGGKQREIRMWMISILQMRKYPLSGRLLMLGQAILEMDAAMQNGDWRRIEAFLGGELRLDTPEVLETGREHLETGLRIAEHMMDFLDARSDSVRRYGEAAVRYFGDGAAAFERYSAARDHFAQVLPEWENWFEHLLVNHMFFAQFPFQDRPVDVKDEFLALCTVYMLLRFLCVGWMADKDDAGAAVDVVAAAFRLIDHTEYDRYAAVMLKELGHSDWTEMHEILCL